MKILYLSCHSVLEHDELKLFEEIGYDYFSIGGYINPKTPHDPKRPALQSEYRNEFASLLMAHTQDNLHEQEIEWADVIIVMHIPEWIEKNWEKIKHKRVIWRTIGQSVEGVERRLAPYRAEGLEIVRYSPMEQNIPGYIGGDAVIRFYKDPLEFNDWVGDQEQVMTIAQSMQSRGEFCNYDVFHAATTGFPVKLYGPGNEGVPESGGQLTYDELKSELRHNRVYFYTGTHPASYTLGFIEAMMTGIPIVSIGSLYGNSRIFPQNTFEVPSIIVSGVNGFVAETVEEMRLRINELMENTQLAKTISTNARAKAIELFGKKTIKEQWRAYLEKEVNHG